MSGVVIDQNPITRTHVRAFEEDGQLILEHGGDVQPVADFAHEMRAQHDGRFKEDFNLALTIPVPVYEDLIRRGIAGDPDAFKAWRRSAEADPWRIHPSRDL